MAALPSLGYIRKPHALMREEPVEASKVVSDAIYSEEVAISQEKEGWLLIETRVDGYKGWVRKKAVFPAVQDFFQGRVAKIDRILANIYAIQDTENGPILSLPFESRLQIREEVGGSQGRWIRVGLVDGREAFVQRGDVRIDQKPLSIKEMVEFSTRFSDLPYTWGGRSTFGLDCSGFTQMLYRQMGVKLPRDSKDQFAWEGFSPVEMEELIPGDLIFFGLAKDKILHVGMYLGGNKFIHSTVKGQKPYVQTSSLKDPDWDGSGRLAFCAARRLKPPEVASKNKARSIVVGAFFSLAAIVACRILKKSA